MGVEADALVDSLVKKRRLAGFPLGIGYQWQLTQRQTAPQTSRRSMKDGAVFKDTLEAQQDWVAAIDLASYRRFSRLCGP